MRVNAARAIYEARRRAEEEAKNIKIRAWKGRCAVIILSLVALVPFVVNVLLP